MRYIKEVVIFVVGAGLGAAAMYKYAEKKWSDIAQEEIDSVKEVFSERETDEVEYQDYVDKKKEVARSNEERKNMMYRNRTGPYTDYNKISEEISEIVEEEPKETTMNVFEKGEENRPPFVISLEEFTNGMIHYDKITLTYYDEDDVLVDDSDVAVDNIGQLIGEEALMCFGEDSDDPDVVYVRNERLGSDFEVVCLHKSYQEFMIPTVESVKKSTKRKRVEEDE